MDVNDGRKWAAGPDRAISQNPDRFRAKRTLDVDLARRDVGHFRYRNGTQQRERIGATPGQSLGGQRHLWRQRERIAQFGVDKFDCAHGWQPGPFWAERNGMAAPARRQVIASSSGSARHICPGVYRRYPPRSTRLTPSNARG